MFYFLYFYVGGLSLTWNQVEVLIVRAVKNRQLSARIDHKQQIISFGDDYIESEQIKRQLSELSKRLYQSLKPVNPLVEETASDHRHVLFSRVRSKMEEEREYTLARQDTIEKRKEMYDKMLYERAKEKERKKAEDEKSSKEQEAARLAAEEVRRNKIKKANIDKEMIFKDTIKVGFNYSIFAHRIKTFFLYR